MNIKGLSHLTLGVKDLDRSREFYSQMFGVSPAKEMSGKDCHFVVGELWFVLVQDAEAKPAEGYSHIAFSVTGEQMEKVSNFVVDGGFSIWQDNETHGESIYFLDPDGNKLEVHSSTWQDRFSLEPK